MERYCKDGRPFTGGSIELDGYRIFNPTPEQLEAAGYELRVFEQYVPTLDDIKAARLAEIDAYAAEASAAEINGQRCLIDSGRLQSIERSIRAAEQMKLDEAAIVAGDMAGRLPLDEARTFLARLQIFADDVQFARLAHRAALDALEDAESVGAYDITASWPQTPSLTL